MSHRKAILGFVLIASWFCLGSVSNAYQDATPPADWNYDGHDVYAEVEEGTDWSIEWTGEMNNILNYLLGPEALLLSKVDLLNQYAMCVGIIRFKAHAEIMTGSGPPVPVLAEGDFIAYFATPKKNDRPGFPNDELNCEDLVDSYVEPHMITPRRPVFLFLHGYPGKGSFFTAAWNAMYLDLMRHKNGQYDYDPAPFVISPSGPGMGHDCTAEDGTLMGRPECRLPYLDTQEQYRVDQTSFGFNGTHEPPVLREGFSGDLEPEYPPNPDYNWFWSISDETLHMLNIIEKVFDKNQGSPDYGLGWTNGDVVIGGFSAGGLTSLIVNGVWEHENLKGVIGIETHGSLRISMANKGDWLADTIRKTVITEAYLPDIKFDCDEIEADPQNATPLKRQVCRTLRYFDPTGEDFLTTYPPRHPVFLTAGAQEEPWTPAGFQKTYEILSDNMGDDDTEFNGVPVYRFLQPDSDHAYYWVPGDGPHAYETYGNFTSFCYETNPTLCRPDPDQQKGINEQYRSAAAFFYSLVRSEAYPSAPPKPDIDRTEDPTDTWKHQLTACWDKARLYLPDEVRFQATADAFWHVLPACTGGSLNSGEYTISEAVYTYNEGVDCEIAWNQDHFDVPEFCINGLEASGGKGFTGLPMTGQQITEYGEDPDEVDCSRFTVNFQGDPPQRFAAWVEFRFDIDVPADDDTDVREIASTGDINFDYYGDGRDSCIRPREDSSSMIAGYDDPFWYAGNAVMTRSGDSNDVAGFVADGMTGEPIPFAAVEIFDNETGEEFDPPLSAQADAFGWAKIEDAPDETVLVKVSADGYPSVLYYGLPRGVGVLPSLYPYSLIDQAYEDVGAEPDEEKATILIGTLYWDEEYPEIWESVGCGKAVLDPAAEVHYAEYDPEVGLSMPTLDRDVTEGGPYNGEGTSPNYEPSGWPVSGFMAFNADAEETEMTFSIGTEDDYVKTIPYVCADCLVFVSYTLMPPAYDPNPTPEWCTE